MQKIDTLISARWVIPVNESRDVLDHHSVAIANGAIIAILPTSEAVAQYAPNEHVELADQALIPGFVNTHGHAAMALFRGMADDLELMTWLTGHIWPAEGKWVSYDFVADGTLLAAAEMIRSGTTTFSDNYFFPDASANSVIKAGMRAQLCFPIIDFPTAWAPTPDQHIDQGLKVMEQYQNHSHIKVNFGPHAPYSVSDEP
ncbi:MAG: amidohydrolase family protein, partial [Reinekea forsetii]|nr:amidohydrolase family protein [Reinekea forsetii]